MCCHLHNAQVFVLEGGGAYDRNGNVKNNILTILWISGDNYHKRSLNNYSNNIIKKKTIKNHSAFARENGFYHNSATHFVLLFFLFLLYFKY